MALYSNNSLKLLTILAFIAINCLAANLKSIANRDKSQQRRVGNNFRDNNGHRVRKNKHWFNVNLNDTDSVKKSALFMKYGSMYGGGYGGGGYGMNTYGGYGGYGEYVHDNYWCRDWNLYKRGFRGWIWSQ